jgi:hypothetical protein
LGLRDQQRPHEQSWPGLGCQGGLADGLFTALRSRQPPPHAPTTGARAVPTEEVYEVVPAIGRQGLDLQDHRTGSGFELSGSLSFSGDILVRAHKRTLIPRRSAAFNVRLESGNRVGLRDNTWEGLPAFQASHLHDRIISRRVLRIAARSAGNAAEL